MKAKLFLILPILAVFLFTGCNEDDPVLEAQDGYKRENNFNKPGDDTIFDIVAAALPDEFTNLYDAIVYVDTELDAGLVEAIQSEDLQLTVFAPTDEAFEELLTYLDRVRPDETIDDITDVPAPIVLAVLQYHLTNGRRASNSVVPRNGPKTIQTLLPNASFTVDNEAKITPVATASPDPVQIGPGDPPAFNISASNGVIHVIDAVLLPLAPGDILALWDELED